MLFKTKNRFFSECMESNPDRKPLIVKGTVAGGKNRIHPAVWRSKTIKSVISINFVERTKV